MIRLPLTRKADYYFMAHGRSGGRATEPYRVLSTSLDDMG
jgi:hypothetical protein